MNTSLFGPLTSWCLLGFSLFFFEMASGSVAFAVPFEGYFPDLNSNEIFRKGVTEALSRRERVVSYRQDNQTHLYVIRYGEDYDAVARYFHNPIRDRIHHLYGTHEDSDQLSTLIQKFTFFSLETGSRATQQYETFIHRPQNTQAHGVDPAVLGVGPAHLPGDLPIPYVGGTFLQALAVKESDLIYEPASRHPEFQGPYFAFTLTEIPPEYLSTSATMKGFKRAKELVKQFVRQKKAGSRGLILAKIAIQSQVSARAALESKYISRYKYFAKERASALSDQSTSPEQTYFEGYKLTREDLTLEEAHELDVIDSLKQQAEVAFDSLYSKEVTAHLTLRELVPYIQQNLKINEVLSSDALSLRGEEGDDHEKTVPDCFIVYALSKVGQATYDDMAINERLAD